jgi:hypothetical protein
MPHSWHHPTAAMLDAVAATQPRSVLDVGPGMGKWGFLCREMLDWMPGRLDRGDWQVRIDGIEVFPYASPLHDWVYDSVRRADVRDVVDECAGYDLVILGDVLEHFDREAGRGLLRALVRTNRNVLLSTPVHFFTQQVADNDHEQHRSVWGPTDFEEFDHDLWIQTGASMVVLLAGVGATIPTAHDRRVNRYLNRVPVVAPRGNLRALVRRLV